MLLIYTIAATAAVGDPLHSVWPQPSSLKSTSEMSMRLSPDADDASLFFQLQGSVASPLLATAFRRYARITFAHAVRPASLTACALDRGHQVYPPTGALVVSVADLDESHPTLHTDESYALNVRPGTPATLSASTVYGALRGLETFSQLVAIDFDCGAYYFPCVSVADAPRFPHRGLMVDTARHYLPLASLRAILDSLPYAKLNVLHWHMADSQSFPFQSFSSPRLWQGAFSASERYTQSDVAGVVEHARLRGVRVMVEFDSPVGTSLSIYTSIYPSIYLFIWCLHIVELDRPHFGDLYTPLFQCKRYVYAYSYYVTCICRSTSFGCHPQHLRTPFPRATTTPGVSATRPSAPRRRASRPSTSLAMRRSSVCRPSFSNSRAAGPPRAASPRGSSLTISCIWAAMR